MRTLIPALAFIAALLASPAGAQSPPGGRDGRAAEPRTVTFDFDSGVKTTLLADGTVLEEGFDPRAMRRIAGRPGSKGVTSSVEP